MFGVTIDEYFTQIVKLCIGGVNGLDVSLLRKSLQSRFNAPHAYCEQCDIIERLTYNCKRFTALLQNERYCICL